MAAFGTEIKDDVVAACKKNLGEIAATFARAFGGKFEIPEDSVALVDSTTLPSDFEAPGLACAGQNDSGILIFVPESAGLLPDWYAKPDASGSNKLVTLALELGFVVLPEEYAPFDAKGARVENFRFGLDQAGVPDAPNRALVTFTVKSGDRAAPLWLLWPAPQSYQVFVAPPAPAEPPAAEKPANAGDAAKTADAAPPSEESPAPPTQAQAATAPPAAKRLNYRSLDDGLKLLPNFSRSLLRIKVPVIVTLATTKQPVRKILEIVPGSIIQFNKSCEEMLTVEVGNQEIAVGEAVKIGDKFGLRVTAMSLPDERFLAVRGTRHS